MRARTATLIPLFGLLLGSAPLQATAPGAPGHVKVEASLGTPVVPAGLATPVYLKVGLTGLSLPSYQPRAPVNVALVLDRSSSMGGGKLDKAKEAAQLLLKQLGPEDLISVVAYDSTAEVVVPATKASDLEALTAEIQAIEPGGSTALFAGVSKALEEVRKFADPGRVNRLILLSDGQANVGPRSPNELGRLGAAAAKQDISITTIGLGLGYNEDLMTQLAMKSDGNHAFAPNAEALAKIFEHELGDIMAVVAQEVTVKVDLNPALRAVRVLNREAEVRGSEIIVKLNQLYANQEKYVLVEAVSPAFPNGTTMDLAQVSVTYADLVDNRTERAFGRVTLAYADDPGLVRAKTNPEVMVAAVESIGNEANRQAVQLRDQGKVEEAKNLLQSNSGYLLENAKRYNSKKLESSSKANDADAENLEADKWNRRRKTMRHRQYQLDTQQSF